MEDNIPVELYVGRFGEERFLCSMPKTWGIPNKGDFIYYNESTYKVLYVLHDLDDNVISVFTRMAVEEDY